MTRHHSDGGPRWLRCPEVLCKERKNGSKKSISVYPFSVSLSVSRSLSVSLWVSFVCHINTFTCVCAWMYEWVWGGQRSMLGVFDYSLCYILTQGLSPLILELLVLAGLGGQWTPRISLFLHPSTSVLGDRCHAQVLNGCLTSQHRTLLKAPSWFILCMILPKETSFGIALSFLPGSRVWNSLQENMHRNDDLLLSFVSK